MLSEQAHRRRARQRVGARRRIPESHLARIPEAPVNQERGLGIRHGVLYAQQYGWDEEFEALVAGIVAEFIKRYGRVVFDARVNPVRLVTLCERSPKLNLRDLLFSA